MQKDNLIRFKNGDEKAFEAIFRHYWNKVYRFAKLYLTDSHEQEEVVQQVFIRLWEKRDVVDESRDLDGLLFIITRNLVFNRSRRSIVMQPVTDVTDSVGGGYELDVEGCIDASELQKYIDKLVDVMPPRQREAFLLSRRDGLSAKEIAERMGISLKGVERHIYLALKFIRSNLPLIIFFLMN